MLKMLSQVGFWTAAYLVVALAPLGGAMLGETPREHMESLREQLDLEIVHVLVEPPAGSEGEAGFVTEELLARHLAGRKAMDLQYFVCGPPPMMGVVERGLVALGVPLSRLYSERFDLV